MQLVLSPQGEMIPDVWPPAASVFSQQPWWPRLACFWVATLGVAPLAHFQNFCAASRHPALPGQRGPPGSMSFSVNLKHPCYSHVPPPRPAFLTLLPASRSVSGIGLTWTMLVQSLWTGRVSEPRNCVCCFHPFKERQARCGRTGTDGASILRVLWNSSLSWPRRLPDGGSWAVLVGLHDCVPWYAWLEGTRFCPWKLSWQVLSWWRL